MTHREEKACDHPGRDWSVNHKPGNAGIWNGTETGAPRDSGAGTALEHLDFSSGRPVPASGLQDHKRITLLEKGVSFFFLNHWRLFYILYITVMRRKPLESDYPALECSSVIYYHCGHGQAAVPRFPPE